MVDARSHDDETADEHCFRHPARTTALSCIECGRPICVDCAKQGAVGFRCPDCAHVPRAARGRLPITRIVLASMVACAICLAGAIVMYVAGLTMFRLIASWLLGAVAGAAAVRATGGARDAQLARSVAGAVAIGLLALPAVLLLSGAAHLAAQHLVWDVLGAAIGAWAAHDRAR